MASKALGLFPSPLPATPSAVSGSRGAYLIPCQHICALHTFGEAVTLHSLDPSSLDETTTQVVLGVIGFEIENECMMKLNTGFWELDRRREELTEERWSGWKLFSTFSS